jgi:protease II
VPDESLPLTVGEFEERGNPKIRALNAGAPATLFKINLDGGHDGASGRYDYLCEIAFDYAWVLREPVLS